MKLAQAANAPSSDKLDLHLPAGLIGLPQMTSFSISLADHSWPFMTMKSLGEERIDFVVIDPGGVVPDYEIELGDQDAESLGIQSAGDAMVLNIVTVHSSNPQYVTVNLVGPVVVNRKTGFGKQVIVQNWDRFSAKYSLIDERGEKSSLISHVGIKPQGQ